AIEPILSGVSPHVLKGLLLLLAGVVTGFVTLQIKRRSLKTFEALEERAPVSKAGAGFGRRLNFGRDLCYIPVDAGSTGYIGAA
ncbi:MAG TPA: hypothetical protein VN256_06375, partial [Pyrinomonadaceae bacterium]|nr:hypothetical protein [Pyrinomonadaceae bacterium]